MKRTVMVLTILAIAATLGAQAPKKKALDVQVMQVNDRRSSGSFAKLTISLHLPGVPTKSVAASRVLLKSATDASGNSLIPENEEEPQLQPNPYAAYAKDATEPMSIAVELENPARDVTSVKEVSGEIELFMPSSDPDSVVSIPKFQSLSGKPFPGRGLKANGIEVSLVTRAQWDAEKKKRADVKREEAKKQGYEGDELESEVTYFLDMLFTPDEGDVLLKVKDPNKRIQDFAYVPKSGEETRVMSREEEGMVVLSTWGPKPEPDTTLRVRLRTPKNVVRYPFTLSNLALP